jgi:hypothetical protein
VGFAALFLKVLVYKMSMLIPPQTVGPASIPTKQNQPNNTTTAVMGMPFKPDPMTQGSFFAMGRAAYKKSVNQNVNSVGQITTPPNYTPLGTAPSGKKKFYGASGSRQCSEHTNLKSIEATGKSSTNALNTQTMSFSGPDQTSVKNALVRCRANGCVAPKKKGAIKI